MKNTYAYLRDENRRKYEIEQSQSKIEKFKDSMTVSLGTGILFGSVALSYFFASEVADYYDKQKLDLTLDILGGLHTGVAIGASIPGLASLKKYCTERRLINVCDTYASNVADSQLS